MKRKESTRNRYPAKACGYTVGAEALEARLMEKPAFREAYKEAEPEFELIRSLIEMRHKRGLSQRALAKAAATKQPAISRIESGRWQGMSIAALQRLAKALSARLVVRFEDLQKPRKRLRLGSPSAGKSQPAVAR